jgi:hypothetical protein
VAVPDGDPPANLRGQSDPRAHHLDGARWSGIAAHPDVSHRTPITVTVAFGLHMAPLSFNMVAVTDGRRSLQMRKTL